MALNDNKFNQDAFARIFDVWARKTPSYEKHYEQEVIKVISDFGKGTNEASDAKGKSWVLDMNPLLWPSLLVCIAIRRCHLTNMLI